MNTIDQHAIDAAHLAGFEEARTLALAVLRAEMSNDTRSNAALARVGVAMHLARPAGREPGDVARFTPRIEQVDADESAAMTYAMRGACDEPGVGFEERRHAR